MHLYLFLSPHHKFLLYVQFLFLFLCAWASGVTPSCSGDIAYREPPSSGTVVGESLHCPSPCVACAAWADTVEGVAYVHSMLLHLHK